MLEANALKILIISRIEIKPAKIRTKNKHHRALQRLRCKNICTRSCRLQATDDLVTFCKPHDTLRNL